ncbi:MAG: protein jag [Clostridia bacterium]|nr:protein jag [Clostridia bacterium]
MIKEAIGTGATVEEAIEAAKSALGAPWDADVSTEILELPKKKTLGLFGGAPAKARAYYEAPEEKKAPVEKVAKEKPVQKKEEKKVAPAPVEKAEAKEPKAYTGVTTDMGKVAKDYVSSILKGMGVEDVEINVTEDDESISLDLDCGNGYGYIIGRRGETLDAIQYLTRLVINKGKDDYRRVSINAGNYRQKREDTLRELAKKQSERVKKYGRNVVLDPMNPYERRIIHTTVQEIEGVSSHSVGSESDRKVVITLAEGFKPTNPGRGRNGRNDYRRRNNNYSSSESKPARAPRSDIGGSLYGKIEPKKPQE